MKEIQDLLQTMATLRGPGGCPWDREQDHVSLARHLLEEAAELLDTIDRGDFDHMREELGDVLLQVVFHAQMASEAGHFTFADVAREINEKLVRRHPHVFGEMDLQDSAAVLVEWEKIKAGEKGSAKENTLPPGPWDDIPSALSALLLGDKIWKRVDQKKPLLSEAFKKELTAEKEKTQTPPTNEETTWAREIFFLLEQSHKKGWDPEGTLRRYIKNLTKT
ncbi:MAG: MazG family protein [Opitutales bacterium]|nr:MazG family protein [Opitutales bacterium]